VTGVQTCALPIFKGDIFDYLQTLLFDIAAGIRFEELSDELGCFAVLVGFDVEVDELEGELVDQCAVEVLLGFPVFDEFVVEVDGLLDRVLFEQLYAPHACEVVLEVLCDL
jgi:hypothetical protein